MSRAGGTRHAADGGSRDGTRWEAAYEIGGNVDATCFGGVAAVHRLVTKLGLPERINEQVPLLKVHLPYHESDHVLNLAYNVLCGVRGWKTSSGYATTART